jgi:hypothetical protein
MCQALCTSRPFRSVGCQRRVTRHPTGRIVLRPSHFPTIGSQPLNQKTSLTAGLFLCLNESAPSCHYGALTTRVCMFSLLQPHRDGSIVCGHYASNRNCQYELNGVTVRPAAFWAHDRNVKLSGWICGGIRRNTKEAWSVFLRGRITVLSYTCSMAGWMYVVLAKEAFFQYYLGCDSVYTCDIAVQ